MKRLAALLVTLLAACSPGPGENTVSRSTVSYSLPPMRIFATTPAPAPTRPNSEMVQDFLDLVFLMESGRSVPTMTRFEGPISVRVTGLVSPTLVPDLRALLQRLNNEAGIDIFLTSAPEASITIEGISQSEMQAAVPRAACFVVPRIGSWEEFKRSRRTPEVDWTTLTQRKEAIIFVPADAAPQEVRDCLHEELAQALGPLNDLYRLPDSVFNDDNFHAVLTGFDMLMLRAYYSPELQNGMTREQVAARLPGLLGQLNPDGARPGGRPVSDTSRDWIDAIETAVSGTASPSRRREAALVALHLTTAFGWDGPRKGFANYVYGRLYVSEDPARAISAFNTAASVYSARPETRIHLAHVAVQMAAFALSAGDADTVLTLVNPSIPVAEAAQNAALLSTLLMFKAEALDLKGQKTDAESVRLDSLGWARYGFGTDINVLDRVRDVSVLTPRNEG
ncbi:MAG: DUF2927 domain-containing protein [Rhodobacterales bacterium]|nr:DUF2927 domain-containing protein [Rhodobacterales bacterium]